MTDTNNQLHSMGNQSVFSQRKGMLTQASRELYGSSSRKFFLENIAKVIPKGNVLRIADLGGANGEFIAGVATEASMDKVFDVQITLFERDQVLIKDAGLQRNCFERAEKYEIVCENLFNISTLYNGRYDICAMRYVLQHNTLEQQKIILQKAYDMLTPDGVLIIEGVGPKPSQSYAYRKVWDKVFSDKNKFTELFRKDYYFSSYQEVSDMFDRLDYHHEKDVTVHYGEVFNATDSIIERYNLSEGKAKYLKELVKEYDYFTRYRITLK